jgi:death on curing protein
MTIGIEDDLLFAIHERQLAEHGGEAGVRDDSLLQSVQATPDIIELATKYTAGIVKNHPFLDGNKRTGFVVGVLFLELNGYRFTASEEAAAQAVLELAAGRIDESGFCEFLRANVKAP